MKIYNINQPTFWRLASKYDGNLPFRRIMSIALLEKCRGVLVYDSDVKIGNDFLCGQEIPYDSACKSCRKTMVQLKDSDTDFKLTGKKCSKIYFFSCDLNPSIEITANRLERFLIGYCIVHSDELTSNYFDEPKTYSRSYIQESVLRITKQEICGEKRGIYDCEISIESEIFKISHGTYFTQQNGITNCCAHAAIQIVLKNYDKNITSHTINEILSNNDPYRSITDMARGLTPQEIIQSIETISTNSESIPTLKPFIIRSSDVTIMKFLESIYRAVESRIPVILLFSLPDSSNIANSFSGHAVSLTGHTVNNHNWCTHGGGYFSPANKIRYLSSWLWCDNFIVQDDNFGPAYHLPTSFLNNYNDFSGSVEKLGLNMSSNRTLDSIGKTYELAALFIPPKELYNYAKRLLYIEQIATKLFLDQINQFGRNQVFKHTPAQKEWFDQYFYHIFKYKSYGPKTFTTRTILVSKQEYLESHGENLFANNSISDSSLEEALNDLLPEYFWITEISTPDLYLINRAKIGEIIISFDKKSDPSYSIRLIRLPYFIALYPEGDKKYYPIMLDQQKEPYHWNINKKEDTIQHYIRPGN